MSTQRASYPRARREEQPQRRSRKPSNHVDDSSGGGRGSRTSISFPKVVLRPFTTSMIWRALLRTFPAFAATSGALFKPIGARPVAPDKNDCTRSAVKSSEPLTKLQPFSDCLHVPSDRNKVETQRQALELGVLLQSGLLLRELEGALEVVQLLNSVQWTGKGNFG